MEDDKLYCPHCGSSQLVANKKGFSTRNAVVGAFLTGGIGLLAGFIGSGKVQITCLKCARIWEAGELRTTPLPPKEEEKEEDNKPNVDGTGCGTALCIMLMIVAIAALLGAAAVACS